MIFYINIFYILYNNNIIKVIRVNVYDRVIKVTLVITNLKIKICQTANLVVNNL